MQAGIMQIENAVILLLCVFRIVAELLHLTGGLRPSAMQVNAFLREYRLIIAQKPDLIPVIDTADDKTRLTQARIRQNTLTGGCLPPCAKWLLPGMPA